MGLNLYKYGIFTVNVSHAVNNKQTRVASGLK